MSTHDAREPAAANGYRVRCTVCGREQMSGESPLTNGWPKCCGYTMRLEDTQRFVADVDSSIREAFDLAEQLMGGTVDEIEAGRSDAARAFDHLPKAQMGPGGRAVSTGSNAPSAACVKPGCDRPATPGYLMCAECAKAGGNV